MVTVNLQYLLQVASFEAHNSSQHPVHNSTLYNCEMTHIVKIRLEQQLLLLRFQSQLRQPYQMMLREFASALCVYVDTAHTVSVENSVPTFPQTVYLSNLGTLLLCKAKS